MKKTVVLIGTLDTKGPEIKYLRDRLVALGLQTIVVILERLAANARGIDQPLLAFMLEQAEAEAKFQLEQLKK